MLILGACTSRDLYGGIQRWGGEERFNKNLKEFYFDNIKTEMDKNAS